MVISIDVGSEAVIAFGRDELVLGPGRPLSLAASWHTTLEKLMPILHEEDRGVRQRLPLQLFQNHDLLLIGIQINAKVSRAQFFNKKC